MMRKVDFTTAAVVEWPTASRTAADSEPLQAADMDDNGGEHQALDQHEGDIAQENRLSDCLAVNAKAHLHADGQEQVPREDPAEGAQDGETGHGDHGGQILGRKGDLDRIQAHHAKRVDLFGHDHGSDLRRYRRSGPAAHTESGDERAQFAGEADCDQVYDKLERAELSQFGGALESQDETGAERHGARHGKGAGSNGEHLHDRRTPTPSGADDRQYARKLAKHRPELHGQRARILHLGDGGTPDLLQKSHRNSTSDPQAR